MEASPEVLHLVRFRVLEYSPELVRRPIDDSAFSDLGDEPFEYFFPLARLEPVGLLSQVAMRCLELEFALQDELGGPRSL